MATRDRFLPGAAEFPTTNYPALFPVNNRPILAFDAATDEAAQWASVIPQGVTGTLHAFIYYIMFSATAGAVRWQVAVEAVTPADSTDLDAGDSFDTANSNGGTVPGTAGFMQVIDVTLTNADSLAAGDLVRYKVNRDADGTSGTDDAAGDAYLLAVEIRDAA